MASETADYLATLTVVELKNILKNHGYKMTGTKNILIERILENIANIILPTDTNISHKKSPSSKNKTIQKPLKSQKSKSKTNSVEDIKKEMYDLKNKSTAYKDTIQELIDNNIQTLNVISHRIDYKEFEILTSAFLLNTSVTSINISNVSMNSRISNLIKKMMLTDRIESLSITRLLHGATFDWLKNINEGIASSTRLSRLSLGGSYLFLKTLLGFVPSLLTITTLKSFDLSSTIPSESSEDIIINAILINNKELQSLNLSTSDLGKIFVPISHNITNSTTLEILDLSMNIFRENDIHALGNIMLNNTSIQHLFIKSISCIGSNEYQPIINGIEHNTSIKTLDISNNIFGKRFIHDLCRAICISNNITYLDISNITGALFDDYNISRAIASVIKANVIEYLDISVNQLDSLRDIGDALAVNTSLKRLRMTQNKCSDMEYFLRSLIKNNYLIDLELTGTYLGPMGAIFGEVVRSNTALKHIDISSTNLDIDAVQAIIDGLRHNDTITAIDILHNPLIGFQLIDELDELLSRNEENYGIRNKQLLTILNEML